MRFFDTSEQPLNLDAVNAALRQIDPAYCLEIFPETAALQGELHYRDGVYSEIEINQSGDGLFDEEVQEQLEAVEEAEEGDPAPVEEILRAANRSVVVRVLWQDRNTEDTLARIDPLWTWLFQMRSGLMQADGEGYYNSHGLVLAVK